MPVLYFMFCAAPTENAISTVSFKVPINMGVAY